MQLGYFHASLFLLSLYLISVLPPRLQMYRKFVIFNFFSFPNSVNLESPPESTPESFPEFFIASVRPS